jgi:trafficking protein particle complex subunit 10
LEPSVGGDNGFQTQTFGKSSADKERPDSRSGSLKTPVRERRHQIPGLRQTPYLRVYFLRCDDNENYKAHARKLVREWIKEHAIPTQSSSKTSEQENHDACEWLIVHIVVPNTAAATQPRISAKGSSTILEKLRADFNGTSKSVVDRVAQIRIGINDVPYDILPRVIPAIPGSYVETPQENEEAWSDLISKFKELILASFDMRVSQYEEDIREKDAQRTLPGWNFCTFFVLKEGLARGFESVGLVEDALVGYDELAVGLNAIIREQVVAGSGAEHGGSFLPFTDDLRSQVEKCKLAMLKETGRAEDTATPIDLQHRQEAQACDQDEIPLSANRKPYRELILANNISIFDFRCYLFARQLSLLLRMGNAWSSREELLAKLKEQRETSLLGVAARHPPPQPTEDTEDLPVLAEICRRALEFVASISRIMREDLLASDKAMRHQSSLKTGQDPSETTMDPFIIQVVNNMVSSFTFSVAQQVLAQTSTKSLPIPPSTLTPPSARLSLYGQESKATIPEPKTMMHPARSSSLAVSSPDPSPGTFPGPRAAIQNQNTALNSKSTFSKTGLEDLAAHRAELYSLSRSVLEGLGDERGWHVGWNTVGEMRGHPSKMEDIDLKKRGSKGEGSQQVGKVTPTLDGIDSKLLRTALDHQDDFYRLYETLTDKALRHYTVASHVQSVQSNIADLALLKFYLRDYAAAASYFYSMTPFYGEGGWEGIELRMLLMYTKSLKELKRNEEYVRVVLKLLTKGIALEKERLFRRSVLAPGGVDTFDNDDYISVDGYVKELMTVIPLLNHAVTAPLYNFFASAEVGGNVRYHEDRDSFALQLKLRYISADDLNIDCAKVRMVPVPGGQGRDLLLETEGPVHLTKGSVRMQLQSNVG